jgi:hypothetical protein
MGNANAFAPMNAVRYGLALILVITLPALLLSWILIYPLCAFLASARLHLDL